MHKITPATERRLFVPETVQTSAMDCGPATLKCLLDGFGVPADYGRLREACQTDVDGTSIDTIEDIALQLGLLGRQVLAPIDHLLLQEAALLPAVVVTVQPNGATHFVVVWRVMGPLIQIMDPATGRRWLTKSQFVQEVYNHQIYLPAADWRAWAGTEGFCKPLQARIQDLGLTESQSAELIDAALADPYWRPLAGLDAVIRIAASLVATRSLFRGPEAVQLVNHLYKQVVQSPDNRELLPAAYWAVQPLLASREAGESEEMLLMTGAVVLTVRGYQPTVSASDKSQPETTIRETTTEEPTTEEATTEEAKSLAPDLAAALSRPVNGVQALLRALRADGLLVPMVLIPSVILSALTVTVEAMLLRGIMDVVNGADLGQKITLALGVFCFMVVLFFLEAPITLLVRRLGRRVETRLRIDLLTKIPQLAERYFHSRLISDMAYRAYSLRQLHGLPGLGINLLRQGSQLIFTTFGVIWMAPGSEIVALSTLVFVMGVAFFSQPLLGERDLRIRTHVSALSRFYLDTLLGLLPIRAHSAERAVRREHEMLFVSWARATRDMAGIEMILQGVVALVSIGSTCWIVLDYLSGSGEARGVLLLLYWSLSLPTLGQALMTSILQYPTTRNHLLRLLEPLGAPEETRADTENGSPLSSALLPASPHITASPSVGVAIELQNVTVVAAGRTILSELNLVIEPGEHVAIIGASGAGKSSMVGLFLGWQQPFSGSVLVDGHTFTGDRIAALRRETAWVDPAVQLWNRSLTANLCYGLGRKAPPPLDDVLTMADLFGVLSTLPDGLSTPLGEGGGLVSGGEGQRVRLGRALLQPIARLAILDEPFRGLDRSHRHRLLLTARQHWQKATLLCITHDITETHDFHRVLVLEGGRIVEDGSPQALMADSTSRYYALVTADAAANQSTWGSDHWRRIQIDGGQVQEV